LATSIKSMIVGNKVILMRLVMILLTLIIGSTTWAYTPPTGVPDPADSWTGFGEIDQASPNAAAVATMCPNWPGTADTNCYYVDNTEGCTTKGNGTPNAPRCTVPRPLNFGDLSATGGYMYIAKGTAEYGLANAYVYGKGSAAHPIWITGPAADNPVFNYALKFGYGGTDRDTQYIVIENLKFHASGIVISPSDTGTTISNILVRNCTAYGANALVEGTAFMVGAAGAYDGSSASNIVFYNNTIRNLGALEPGQEDDACGVYVQNSSSTWILNNNIYQVGGDSIGGCHTCNYGNHPQNLFIGKNILYGNGENCIDLKGVENFIVSENICYGPFMNQQGWGLVVHDAQGADQHDSTNGWFLFNNFYHLTAGFVITTGANEDMYFIGNIISDIDSAYDNELNESSTSCDADNSCGYAIAFTSSYGQSYVIDNTLYDYEKAGVNIANALGETDFLEVAGNIFYRTGATGSEIRIAKNGSEAQANITRNLFYAPNDAGGSDFYWAGGSRNYAYLTGTAGECGGGSPNCVDGSNPKFVSTTNFTLQSDSPAIGANVEGPVGATVYDAFATAWSAYSVTIEKDYAGRTRPQGGSWDIGAYEYMMAGQSGQTYSGVSLR
jgi:hypothetical protein